MAKFLIQAGYTAESIAAQIKDPRNVIERVRGAVEQLGGRVECCYYTFGDLDILAILELPDAEAAAAFSMLVGAAGAVRSFRTTPLLSIDEGMSAMRKAAGAAGGYQAAR